VSGRYELSGKVVLITGAAQGIGLGTARAMHARGASVALVDLDAAATQAAAASVGERALGLGGDVTDGDSLKAAVAATVERFGGLDVAVANAGISPTAATARVYEDGLWERVIDVNLLGAWRTVRAALPEVVPRRGQIVLVSSIYAFTNGTFVSPYAASKAGVEQLGRALRVELGSHGVTSTTAYFGFVDTAMVQTALRDDPLGERFHELIPWFLHKTITPGEAGEAVARAVERRAVSVVAPRRWRLLSVLRGIVNPMVDKRFAVDRRLGEIIREADVEGRLAAPRPGAVPDAAAGA
jgi:NAD(P)-dependent dehydrogenase (short-subunit alcohol dehydrogenase family)